MVEELYSIISIIATVGVQDTCHGRGAPNTFGGVIRTMVEDLYTVISMIVPHPKSDESSKPMNREYRGLPAVGTSSKNRYNTRK